MHMIAHQAVAHDSDGVASTVLAQQLEVKGAVCIFEKPSLPMVSALRDVVPAVGHHDACHSCRLN